MAFRTIGYFENWAQYRQAGGKIFPGQIDPNLFTHINFAFALFGFITWSVDPNPDRTGPQRLTGDYSVQPTEWNDETVLFPALNALKQQNPNLKTLLSIGGWIMNRGDDVPTPGNPHPYGPYTYQLFSKMVADPNGRAQFINSAIAFAQHYGFDGIDLDWEYPGDSTRGGTPNDLANFLTLLQEFRAAAGPNFLLSMASPAIVPSGLPPQWGSNPQSFFAWLASCAQYLDWLNMETYDYHGSFDPASVGTGVNSPLLADSTPNGPFSMKNSVESYLAAGIPGAKINLGLPTYGRSYSVANPSLLASHPGPGLPFSGPGPAGPATEEAGTLAYYEIVQQLLANSLTSGWDQATLTPYAYNAQTGVWVSYDNEQSIGYKVSYLLQKGLGGAMFWAIDDDAFPSMADTLREMAGQIAHARPKRLKKAATAFPLINTAKAIFANPSTAPPLPTPGPVTTQNWMSDLPNDIKLSQLTIPGTHESCARGIGWPAGPFANCQDLSLADQLNAGIRYLDIRCRHISDIFAIHHEAFYLGLNFGNGVRDVCVRFLQANPSECILMEIKREYNDAGNNLTFQQVFDNYVKGFENFFYLADNIPTLGDARGKIVVVCRFTLDTDADTHTHGINANPWADNATFTLTYTASNNETVTLTIQDNYNWTNVFNDNIDAKYSDIWNTLLQAQADGTDRLFINFTSASSSDGAASAQNFVYGINPRLYNDLAKFGPSWPNRLGVLAMDFVNDGGPPNPFPPADAVIQRVISFNDKLKTSSKATGSQLLEAVGV